MNTIFFTGKLFADAKIIETGGRFISFTMYEANKGKDATKIDCTQNFHDDPPKVVEYLKKSATVAITGTPYAKINKDKSGGLRPIIGVFVDRIDIIHFAPQEEEQEEQEQNNP